MVQATEDLAPPLKSSALSTKDKFRAEMCVPKKSKYNKMFIIDEKNYVN